MFSKFDSLQLGDLDLLTDPDLGNVGNIVVFCDYRETFRIAVINFGNPGKGLSRMNLMYDISIYFESFP